MFEKEAEEEINKEHWTYSIFKDLAQEYWQKGAEFGYNKAKEEMQAQIEKMRNFENCDYQLHIVDCPIFKSGGHISCKKCPHWTLQEIKENDL